MCARSLPGSRKTWSRFAPPSAFRRTVCLVALDLLKHFSEAQSPATNWERANRRCQYYCNMSAWRVYAWTSGSTTRLICQGRYRALPHTEASRLQQAEVAHQRDSVDARLSER